MTAAASEPETAATHSLPGGAHSMTSRADTGTTLYEANPVKHEVAYPASPVKRVRRTNAQLEAVDEAIIQAVEVEKPVTLRGVYYRVVSAGAVEKTEAAYDLVGRQLIKLRRSGVVPYSWITDGTRLLLFTEGVFADADQMLRDAAVSYRRAIWEDQEDAVIILSEKDAISGVISGVTDQFQVELGIVRGYSSETYTHSIAESVNRNAKRGRVTYIYQLGDHDPSGLDAWRSFKEKVLSFDDLPPLHDDVHFERLAVTPEQISFYDLQTRPTKQSDSRAKSFEGESVEVDALPPTVLRQLVGRAIRRHIDFRALQLTERIEEQERQGLLRLAGSWQLDHPEGSA